MDTDPPLEYMLSDVGGTPAGRDELQAIVARSGRLRTRLAAVGMIGTLAVGTVAGWAANSGRSSGTTGLAAGGATTTTPARAPGFAVTGGAAGAVAFPGIAPTLTKKFVRMTTDGVTIRGFAWDGSKGMPASCGVFLGFQAEVSTAEIAGVGSAFVTSSKTAAPFNSVTATTLGDLEKSPVRVVTVNTGAGVAQVRATFADGKTDQMAPVDGWSVLAHQEPQTNADKVENDTVQALDSNGTVVGTQSTFLAPPGPGKPSAFAPATAVVPSSAPEVTGTGSTRFTAAAPSTIAAPTTAPAPFSAIPPPPVTAVPRSVCGVTAPGPGKPGVVPAPNVTPPTAPTPPTAVTPGSTVTTDTTVK